MLNFRKDILALNAVESVLKLYLTDVHVRGSVLTWCLQRKYLQHKRWSSDNLGHGAIPKSDTKWR